MSLLLRMICRGLKNIKLLTVSLFFICFLTTSSNSAAGVLWYTSKATAFEMAKSQKKKVLLVGGRQTCSNCSYMVGTVCETTNPPIKSIIEEHFIPWFCYVDYTTDWHPYAPEDAFTLPLICVIDPNTDTHLDRTTGIQSVSDFYNRLLKYIDDAYEENNTWQTSSESLKNRQSTLLSSISGKGVQLDDDWYKIEIPANSDRVIINATFSHSAGNIDIELRNADSPDVTQVTSASTTDNETIDYELPDTGAWLIRVHGDNSGNSYDLSWHAIIDDDDYEENNTWQTASESLKDSQGALLSSISGQGVQLNDDWYKIEIPAGMDHVIINATFSHSTGNIDIELMDADSPDATHAGSASTTDNEKIDCKLPDTGAWLIRVYGDNSGNRYDLSWHAIIDDDAYEENDTWQTASESLKDHQNTPLSSISGKGVQLNDDWYLIEIPANSDRVVINTTFSHSAGNIDIELRNADSPSEIRASGTSTTDNETIDHELLGPGIWLIRVYGDNSGNRYDLSWHAINETDLTNAILVLKILTNPYSSESNIDLDVDGDQRTGPEEAIYSLQKAAGLNK